MTRCLPWMIVQRRATLLSLIGVISASAGCHSSLRLVRKDEPSIRELLVHPQPWDAEAREAEASGNSPSNSSASNIKYGGRSSDRYGDTYGGRPNPYSANSLANAERTRGLELPDEDADDSEWAPFLQDLPPSLWPLAKRQFHARRSSTARADQQRTQVDSDQFDTEDDAAEQPESTVYNLRDEDESEPRSSTKAGATSKLVNSKTARPEAKAIAAPTHFHLRDDSDGEYEGDDGQVTDQRLYASTGVEEGDPQRLNPRRHPAELTPPSNRKSSRQIAHAEPIDTGAGDDVRVMPPRDQYQDESTSAKASSVVSQSSNKKRKADSAVVPASAEVDDESSAVQPASAQRPIRQRPVEVPEAEDADARDSQTNSSSPKTKKLSSQDHLHEALRRMDEEWTNTLTPTEQLQHQAVRRLVLLASGQFEGAMEPIEALQAHEQEFFRHSLQAWHHAIDPSGNPVLARRWPLVLNSQREALAQLAAISSLEVKNVAFCSNVEGFGSITKFPTAQFRSGQELLLYCEIDNFISEQVKDGFETKLQGSYEIVDASNVKVADVLLPQDAEVCKRARRDYFLVYRIYMPSKIEPGRYQLRLTIEDMKGKKFGQSSLDFQVGT